MKSNRKTMLAAALVVAVVALAGAGYAAATAYHAVSVSSDANVNSSYVTVSQFVTSAKTVDMDTYNTGTTTYIIPGTSVLADGKSGLELWTQAVNIGYHGFTSGSLKVKVDVEGTALPGGWTYMVGITGATATYGAEGTEFTMSSATAESTTITVYLAGTTFSTEGKVGVIEGWNNCASGSAGIDSAVTAKVVVTVTSTPAAA